MTDNITKPENGTSSGGHGDAITASAGHGIDRLRDELAAKSRNYEDVISHHVRTEAALRAEIDRLRDLVIRLCDNITHRHLVGERERALLREARAAIGEDDKWERKPCSTTSARG